MGLFDIQILTFDVVESVNTLSQVLKPLLQNQVYLRRYDMYDVTSYA